LQVPWRKNFKATLVENSYQSVFRTDSPESLEMKVDYATLAKTVAALTAGESDPVALMATVVCEVYHADDRFDWVGSYRVVEPELLKIGPYQGGHGCLTVPFERGVCGAAARTGQVQLVADVHSFAGHIACASSTRSELVLPVWNGRGEVIAVFDIDSDQSGAFGQDDSDALEAILSEAFAL
jgi:L-methionine (R)-S-oxide reductase